MRGGFYQVIFGEGVPGILGSSPVVGFLGPGLPGPRRVDLKRKARDRRRKKLVRSQKAHMRRVSG